MLDVPVSRRHLMIKNLVRDSFPTVIYNPPSSFSHVPSGNLKHPDLLDVLKRRFRSIRPLLHDLLRGKRPSILAAELARVREQPRITSYQTTTAMSAFFTSIGFRADNSYGMSEAEERFMMLALDKHFPSCTGDDRLFVLHHECMVRLFVLTYMVDANGHVSLDEAYHKDRIAQEWTLTSRYNDPTFHGGLVTYTAIQNVDQEAEWLPMAWRMVGELFWARNLRAEWSTVKWKLPEDPVVVEEEGEEGEEGIDEEYALAAAFAATKPKLKMRRPERPTTDMKELEKRRQRKLAAEAQAKLRREERDESDPDSEYMM
ncbi:hypothetical protein BCR44DRAFT_36770 [Catenaria anguillulae PL171]|uniref:Uncharacterized protein n=1 Tax=Catenaria anguillulae PL171 TaxID=765915 RepID=A0A1Y2HVJ4_9FUNG|nr:hypothetical protein BCR44DRAFT_1443936 [Catenaria anguillulae PL171]ORZ38635.1 hypothetical protein BCR44DRAFT_36770 [Catenaria anguillulae PL171]